MRFLSVVFLLVNGKKLHHISYIQLTDKHILKPYRKHFKVWYMSQSQYIHHFNIIENLQQRSFLNIKKVKVRTFLYNLFLESLAQLIVPEPSFKTISTDENSGFLNHCVFEKRFFHIRFMSSFSNRKSMLEFELK